MLGALSRQGAGYSLKLFSEVCEISSALVDPRQKEYLDLLHVGGANIATKTGELTELKTAREEGLISGKFVFDATMVLYSKIRPYLMKVARPDFRGLCSADIYPLSVKSGQLNRDYLFHLLLSPGFTDYANAGSARAGMPKVNRDHLFSYRVSLPSVATQKKLAAELDVLHQETQRLESIHRRKLAALDDLKQSLLHQAFSGALTAKAGQSVVVPLRPKMSATDLHAGILAIAFQFHEEPGCQHPFGHVKAEKVAHMVEAWLDVDLGRNPLKDAAGPNDFRHLIAVEHRAEKVGYFTFKGSEAKGYRFSKGRGFDTLVIKTREALGDKCVDLDRLCGLIARMNTRQAEIFATTYAAWNNLLLDQQPVTDEHIVFEARDNWHPDKLKIPEDSFFKAIAWMRAEDLVPTGQGKRVVERKIKQKKN
ncbi:MAG: restriction endonuclease subunit S [Betaproteobacteria bacterium]